MKQLYRSRYNRKIAGVCGGLGVYFDLDPTIVRLLFIFVAIFTAGVPMILGYILAWLIIPEE
jgi:phage shock protein C